MQYEDITPDADLLIAFCSEDWQVKGALAELVDNSFGQGDASTLTIDWDRRKRHLIVLDDGRGMSATRLLFQLGKGAGRSPKDIAKYGLGGTLALLWLAAWDAPLSVHSLRDGQIERVQLAYSALHARVKSSGWALPVDPPRPSHVRNTPMDLIELGHGTRIELTVSKARRWDSARVRAQLERLFAPGLRHGKRIIWVEGNETIELAPPIRRGVARSFSFKGPGELWANGEVFRGSNLTIEESRVAICFGHRVIFETTDCYSNPDGSKDYSGRGVGAFIDLGAGWQHHLTKTKTEINDAEIRDGLMNALFSVLQPYLEEAERDIEQIELDLLAATLGATIEGSLDIPVYAKRRPGTTGGHGGYKDPNPEPESGQGELVEDEAGTKETPAPRSGAALLVQWADDKELDGCIVSMEHLVRSDGTVVFTATVNQEIPHVIEARARKNPTQTFLLQSLLVPQLVGYMFEVLDDRLRRRVLKNIHDYEQFDNHLLQGQYVTAKLLTGAAKSVQTLGLAS